jgi:hypothetical protein
MLLGVGVLAEVIFAFDLKVEIGAVVVEDLIASWSNLFRVFVKRRLDQIVFFGKYFKCPIDLVLR